VINVKHPLDMIILSLKRTLEMQSLRGVVMDKKIDNTYAVIALVEILYEEKLINEPTLKAIILRLQDEQSHISQTSQ